MQYSPFLSIQLLQRFNTQTRQLRQQFSSPVKKYLNYLGDTLEEIVNVTADSPHSSKLLLGAEPLLHLNKIRVTYKNSHVFT
jgi:hypothetical protein